MASQKVAALTRQDIIKAARNFKWHRQMPKWTTIVDGTELPARPLVLEAAGVPPNDPTWAGPLLLRSDHLQAL